MRIFILLLILLFPSLAYSAPSTTVSISPSAVDATTITASDENTRNSAISTWANVHDHNDIDQTANTLAVGDATAGNKTLQANNADTNKPYIRYDDTNDRWVSSRDGSTVETFLVLTGSTGTTFIFPQSPSSGDHLIYNGNVWEKISTLYKVGSFSRDISTASGTQTVTGVGFQPKSILFLSLQVSAVGKMSVGVDDGTTAKDLADEYNVTANTWTTDGSNSINIIESGTAKYVGKVQSFNSDGFTISWTKTGSPTGTVTVNYIAFR